MKSSSQVRDNWGQINLIMQEIASTPRQAFESDLVLVEENFCRPTKQHNEQIDCDHKSHCSLPFHYYTVDLL